MPKRGKLQWAPTTAETAEAAQAYEYFRLDEHVVMLYGGRAHELFREADDAFVQRMSAEELEWLKGSIEQHAASAARRSRHTAERNDAEFMAAFERELEREKQSMSGKEGTEDGDGTAYQAENQQQ